ncbi:tetratricopeptide repeat protein [Verrucomicrobiaceae bacterium 5K15]|uniref:Tetratricopeptide repeat protein n=1 Tax=Oceaniferula flava TaxID=2800421 RepID=A0AAE2SBV2_9BACT|nr:tetratricopeptide repeat protein [Oceaniferula flavus]MBK1855008.1 tetratricopeptide repeat protein [Oceaniferula flavus]MBM1136314.1 tetratricopeptide repeat protein [Oceaniferula flavus]
MKRKTTTMIVALTLAVGAPAFAQSNTTSSPPADRATQANTLYQQGVIAMRSGHYDAAASSFRQVLQLYPKHLKAKQNLLYILENKDALVLKKRKAALKTVIIPSVDFDKETVQESLTILASLISRESNKKVAPNFIVQDPKGQFENRSITLRLNNIPAETLLNYIVTQAGARVRYDAHAIVVTPRG